MNEIYQGEHIPFVFNFTAGSNPAYAKFSDFKDVFIILYTDSCFQIKFSMNQADGFELLTLENSDLRLTGVALPELTSQLKVGSLQYELRCIGTDGGEAFTKQGLTGTTIKQSLTKNIPLTPPIPLP
ncbi:MAG: hypothetical protein JXQ69_03745 [Paludibacteraceae bacterium]|nr:hypothetical protein [Paludibacteraceae bacterium]